MSELVYEEELFNSNKTVSKLLYFYVGLERKIKI